MKEFDNQTLINTLVLTTLAKDEYGNVTTADLFDDLEVEIILKMPSMVLSDLINLLWSV